VVVFKTNVLPDLAYEAYVTRRFYGIQYDTDGEFGEEFGYSAYQEMVGCISLDRSSVKKGLVVRVWSTLPWGSVEISGTTRL